MLYTKLGSINKRNYLFYLVDFQNKNLKIIKKLRLKFYSRRKKIALFSLFRKELLKTQNVNNVKCISTEAKLIFICFKQKFHARVTKAIRFNFNNS